MKKIFLIVTLLFLVSFTYARSETEKYSCIEVKTDLAGDEIQYSVNKENHAEFTLRDCLPENLKIQVENSKITYKKSRRLVENGKIERNDLFAIECSEPFPEDGDMSYYEGIRISFYRGRISPLITPEYPLYPTLKQIAEKLNLDIPHRTFVVFSGFGGSTHEFFCYVDKKPSQDKCTYTFDEVLDIHFKNKDAVSLGSLGEKYLKRLKYDKAEKAYIMSMKLDLDYQPLLSLYTTTKQYEKAIKLLSGALNNNPYNASLYIDLAKLYFYEGDYGRAQSSIKKAFKLHFEDKRKLCEAYEILGDIYITKREFTNAIASFKIASELSKQKCEEESLLLERFLDYKVPPINCDEEILAYQLKILYSLIEIEYFKSAEKLLNKLLTKTSDDPENYHLTYLPYFYHYLSIIYAGMGKFDKAIEMADKAVSLFKRKGIGATVEMGEIYPQIVSVNKNSPAERAGLKRGDKIINIGDKDLRFFRGQDLLKMIVDYLKENTNPRLKIHSQNSPELKEVEIKSEELLQPAAGQILAFKALVLRVIEKQDEFEKISLKAYELNPEDKLTLITMAIVNSDKGRYSEATKILEKLEKDSNDSLVLLIRPLVYAKAKDMDKAKKFYKKIPVELLKSKNALYKRLLDEIGVLGF